VELVSPDLSTVQEVRVKLPPGDTFTAGVSEVDDENS
jgi:hypothetical protein